MNCLILAAIFAILTIVCFIAAAVKDARQREAAAWQIVCSPDGKFTFTDEDGDLYWADFSTRGDAEKRMAEKQTGVSPEVVENWRREQRERAARFKPCN